MTPTKILSTPNKPTGHKVVTRLAWVLCAAVLVAAVVAGLTALRLRPPDNAVQAISSLTTLIGFVVLSLTGALIISRQPRNTATGAAQDLFAALLSLGILAFPIAIGIAILRYQLYDIDIVIRKTLQYTVVTVLLALIYFGSVFLLQRLFSDITGEQSPLILVVSTLLTATLFAPPPPPRPGWHRPALPILRCTQDKKYNAQQVLAAFARTARDEPDPSLSLRTGMDALLAEMERVIQETLQPEGVQVWLRQEAPIADQNRQWRAGQNGEKPRPS